MSVRHGDLVRMTSFTHVEPTGRSPLQSLTMKVSDKSKVAVFMLLGEENKDGTDPLDAERDLMNWGGSRRLHRFRARTMEVRHEGP